MRRYSLADCSARGMAADLYARQPTLAHMLPSLDNRCCLPYPRVYLPCYHNHQDLHHSRPLDVFALAYRQYSKRRFPGTFPALSQATVWESGAMSAPSLHGYRPPDIRRASPQREFTVRRSLASKLTSPSLPKPGSFSVACRAFCQPRLKFV